MPADPLDALAKPPPPPSELDELMSRDPLELSAADIDKIIAIQRQHRARLATPGGRARKAKDEAPKQSIDLVAALGLIKPAPPPSPTSVPGVVSSFRRRF